MKEEMKMEKTIQETLESFHQNQKKYIDVLKTMITIPSISFPEFDQSIVAKCGEYVAQTFREFNLENVQILTVNDKNKPYIYGQWMKAPGKPTILLYGHYDVQPPGKDESWISPAFVPEERNGRLYGRGSSDDKGGVLASLAAFDSWLKTHGDLPVNVKILAEGEEECGSSGLNEFISRYKDLIQADAIVIVDADNFSDEIPGLTISLRGLIAATVEIKTLKQPVHSGLLGGALPDAAMALSKMLSAVVDEKGDLIIPEVIQMRKVISETQREALRSLPFDKNKFRKEVGILENVSLLGSEEDIRERMWFLPSFSVNAMQAGSRAQAGNIIVESAWARVGIRTTEEMDAKKVFLALKKYLEKSCPFGLKVEVKEDSCGNSWKTKTDHEMFRKMEKALAQGWGKFPVKMGCGASIPFVETFTNALNGAPALLIGVGDPLTYAHSENESLNLEVWRKTAASLIHFIGSFDSLEHLL